MDEPEITALVSRLSRPHPSGGVVIERAAIMAAGTDFTAIVDWITAHDGAPDTTASPARRRGLHGLQTGHDGVAAARAPLRYVLPAGAVR